MLTIDHVLMSDTMSMTCSVKGHCRTEAMTYCFGLTSQCLISTEYAQLFAALIARTAKDIDVLIDSLPSEESTAALQVYLLWST